MFTTNQKLFDCKSLEAQVTVVPVPVLDLVTLVMLLLLVVEVVVTVLRVVVRLLVELSVRVVAYRFTFTKLLSCSCYTEARDIFL